MTLLTIFSIFDILFLIKLQNGDAHMSQNRITIIEPKRKWYHIGFKELVQYKDLIFLFVKRDFSTLYKQTILGPAWILLNPFLTTVLFTIIFGQIAKISTQSIPQFLFYMCGNILWGFFSQILNKTSSLYLSNASLLKKVYFPRLSLAVTTNITSFINFFVQLLMFLGFLLYFLFIKSAVKPNLYIFCTPLLLLISAFLATGVGLIITAVTTKYRDLSVLTSFGVSLWFYVTPIVYPLSSVPDNIKNYFLLNPMTSLTEGFRYAFLGAGDFNFYNIFISAIVSILIFTIGLFAFARSERNFSDTL